MTLSTLPGTAPAPGTGQRSPAAEGWPGLADGAPLGELFLFTYETGAMGSEGESQGFSRNPQAHGI